MTSGHFIGRPQSKPSSSHLAAAIEAQLRANIGRPSSVRAASSGRRFGAVLQSALQQQSPTKVGKLICMAANRVRSQWHQTAGRSNGRRRAGHIVNVGQPASFIAFIIVKWQLEYQDSSNICRLRSELAASSSRLSSQLELARASLALALALALAAWLFPQALVVLVVLLTYSLSIQHPASSFPSLVAQVSTLRSSNAPTLQRSNACRFVAAALASQLAPIDGRVRKMKSQINRPKDSLLMS